MTEIKISCPNCGKNFDAHTDPRNPDVRPRPGDWSICIYCLCALVFTEDMTLAIPDPDMEIPQGIEEYRNAIQAIEKSRIER